jgi:hypothetical protein
MEFLNTITVPVYGLNFAPCGQTIERRLRELPEAHFIPGYTQVT